MSQSKTTKIIKINFEIFNDRKIKHKNQPVFDDDDDDSLQTRMQTISI